MSFYLKTDPKHIDFVNKIFEGYDGLALVTTIDRKKGLLVLHVSPENMKDVGDILDNFPKPVRYSDTIEELL